jgi:hypothetical protein
MTGRLLRLALGAGAWLFAACVQGHALDCRAPRGLGPLGAPRLLSPTVKTDPAPSPAGVTTLALLPDIQYYTKCGLPHLGAQMQWLAEQSGTRNLRAALFAGDLTEHNSAPEWRFVRDQLMTAQWQVPLVLTTGNHDEGHNGNAHHRVTLLPQFFPEPPGIAQSALAETMRPHQIDDAYYRIELPHVTLGVLALEWAPRASTVAWANEVLSRHADDRVIVLTHAYLYDDSTRYDWRDRGAQQLWNPLSYTMAKEEARGDPESDGETLWNALIRKNPGIFLVLCGHVGGTGAGYLESRGDAGNLVAQVLANFQLLDEGGLGFMRLFEIQPDGRSLRMKTYSPSTAEFAIADAQQAVIPIEPALW